MGRFVNPDSSAFQVALNSRIYVDKTGLIEYTNSVLDTTNAYICNSRPRRFGKSYAANMLAAYYSKGTDSEQMFSGLRISKDADFKKHLNKYDVLLVGINYDKTSQEHQCRIEKYEKDWFCQPASVQIAIDLNTDSAWSWSHLPVISEHISGLTSVCWLSRKHLILLTFAPFSGIMIARILTKTNRFSCSFLQILSI